jgi:hypothetical protein
MSGAAVVMAVVMFLVFLSGVVGGVIMIRALAAQRADKAVRVRRVPGSGPGPNGDGADHGSATSPF